MSFVLNTNHKVYHTMDCPDVNRMLEENKQFCENKPVYARPCSHCKPELTTILTEDSETDVWEKYLKKEACE